MADNVTINQGSGGPTVATDEVTTRNGSTVAAEQVQRVKVGYGSDGALRDVDSANPLPASDATAQGKLDTLHTDVGSAGSSPPSLDTGASGLLGWLRKIYGALATTASNFLAVRLTDGSAYLGTVADRLKVDVGGSLPAGTNNIGDVDVLTLPSLPAGSNTIGNVTPTAAGDVATTLTKGRKTIAAVGTAEAIRATLACKWVTVMALKTNTQVVAVGPSGVLAASGTNDGLLLEPGEKVTIPVNDANKVFADVRVAGEGVSFLVGS